MTEMTELRETMLRDNDRIEEIERAIAALRAERDEIARRRNQNSFRFFELLGGNDNQKE